MRTHMSIDIAKAVKWSDQDLGLFTDKETGKYLPPDEIRQMLASMLKEGKEKFPCGDCDNFDYKTGCLGHSQTEKRIEMTLGERLKSERILINVSLREAAKNIGTTHGYLSKIENNIVDHPSIWTIWRLCKYYKIPIDAVINERFAPKTAPANRDK